MMIYGVLSFILACGFVFIFWVAKENAASLYRIKNAAGLWLITLEHVWVCKKCF
jgi:hypothetical protein